MSSTVAEVLTAALTLPEPQRAELVDALIDSFDCNEAGLDEAWLQEIERRSLEYDSGSALTHSWEEVRERARRACGFDG